MSAVVFALSVPKNVDKWAALYTSPKNSLDRLEHLEV